jgi:hypothetical protein
LLRLFLSIEQGNGIADGSRDVHSEGGIAVPFDFEQGSSVGSGTRSNEVEMTVDKCEQLKLSPMDPHHLRSGRTSAEQCLCKTGVGSLSDGRVESD